MYTQLRDRLYGWYGKKAVRSVVAIILVLCAGAVIVQSLNSPEPESERDHIPSVTLRTVGNLSASGSLSLIGSVEAIHEVRLESEASGRITRVPVSLGQQVAAGTTIALIENANEYAALLQAEGAYEAALASAASSDVNVVDVRSNAVNAYRSAYTTVNSIIINTVDDIFTNPRSPTPGLRISGFSHTAFLNDERVQFNTILSNWQQEAASIAPSDNLISELQDARRITERTLRIVETVISVLPRQEVPGVYTQAELDVFQSDFVSAQASLNATVAGIDNAIEALQTAELGGTGGDVSSADALIKQALGSLRAAQANYAKTIIKTPIAGTVNDLPAKAGTYVSIGTPVATVANNNALTITTFIGSADRSRLAIGDVVMIEDEFTGTVTNIAPSVDPVTKKIEVQIQTESDDVENGDTVRLTISAPEDPEIDADAPLSIPVTALKVETDRIVVFTVNDESRLVAHAVETGPLMGSAIIIESGLTLEQEIVLDARGLNEGDEVTINEA